MALPAGLPSAVSWPATVVVAAFLGSFLNVCISRVPRGESIVSPPSHCPRCQAPIRFYDNIPLVSFAVLGGRCRTCQEPISWRYPLVEALAVGLGVLVLWQLGPTWEGLRAFVLGLALIAVTFIDFELFLIPDRITLPGIGVGLALSLASSPRGLLMALAGCLAAGAVFYVIAMASRGGMGGGDIKLAAMLGAFLGWPLVFVGIFAAVMLGGLVAIGLLLSGRRGRKDAVPFGPFLALGGMLAALWGRPFLAWYLA